MLSPITDAGVALPQGEVGPARWVNTEPAPDSTMGLADGEAAAIRLIGGHLSTSERVDSPLVTTRLPVVFVRVLLVLQPHRGP
jgi:hypothetical protein